MLLLLGSLKLTGEVSAIFHPLKEEAYDGGEKKLDCYLERSANPKAKIDWYKDAAIISKNNDELVKIY